MSKRHKLKDIINDNKDNNSNNKKSEHVELIQAKKGDQKLSSVNETDLLNKSIEQTNNHQPQKVQVSRRTYSLSTSINLNENNKQKEVKYIILNHKGLKHPIDFEILHEYFNMKVFNKYMKNKPITKLLSECNLLFFYLDDNDHHVYYQQFKKTIKNLENYLVVSAYIAPRGKKLNLENIKKELNCDYVKKKIDITNIKDRDSAVSNIFVDHISSDTLKKTQIIIGLKGRTVSA